MKNVLELIEFQVKLPVISHLESEAGGPEVGRAPVPFPLLWLVLRDFTYTYSTCRCPMLLRTGEDNRIKVLYLLHKEALILSTSFFSPLPRTVSLPHPTSSEHPPGPWLWALYTAKPYPAWLLHRKLFFVIYIFPPNTLHSPNCQKLYLTLLKYRVKSVFMQCVNQIRTWKKLILEIMGLFN